MFCSKCGRQINNDALFCTFCGSPTGLAAQSAPIAPPPAAQSVPAATGVPTPQSIPMNSESYAAANVSMPVGGASQSIPAQNTTDQDLGAVSAVKDDRAESEFTESAAETLPFGEEITSENTESGENSYVEPTEYGENNAQSSALEQPSVSAPLQPAFAARESTGAPELVTAGAGTMIDFSAPIQPVQPAEESEKPAKYTFGHIALCLAAVGVMAIVAGIFAGLYFSVI